MVRGGPNPPGTIRTCRPEAIKRRGGGDQGGWDPATKCFTQGMMPCVSDLYQGSLGQANKRNVNSDASRVSHKQKRNEMQLGQKIAAQEDEIRKQSEALQRQAQDIRVVMQERGFYRPERDFYCDHARQLEPASQLLARPVSPPGVSSVP
ncbi:uncharacterized protein LDX57_005835 [Aspergillus melleus]|uniref:uncharacterized protein n=1 Tax=Aspergillus melleus TaxID=138277 RepID=UPI001E8D25F6|nr:uncharacterized protein LDX57_005835 [Aspergillus melleus]KAH8428130.1 hypothetical protein LDX57_005835 [Aspergillus melleus]